MLITRKIMAEVEKYFICFLEREFAETEYDKKMYQVVERIIDVYKSDSEKSVFIQKCLFAKKSWKQTYDVFHIERRTYFAWREEILCDAVICAISNKLMDLGANLTFTTNE